MSKTKLLVAFLAALVGGLIVQLAVCRMSQAAPADDRVWAGWMADVAAYAKTRKPGQNYSDASLREAVGLFVAERDGRRHPRTHHWAAVRLVNEIMVLDRLYEASWGDPE